MDIWVGGTEGARALRSSIEKRSRPGGFVEAKVLQLRAPRSSAEARPGKVERRESEQRRDPAGGKVLVLLIPDGSEIPPGLDSGEYRVLLRFARR